VPLVCQKGEKLADVVFPQIGGMDEAMVTDIKTDPVQIGLYGAHGIAQHQHLLIDGRQKGRGGLAHGTLQDDCVYIQFKFDQVPLQDRWQICHLSTNARNMACLLLIQQQVARARSLVEWN